MRKGFTLIELLVVIVIVGILVTVSLPKYKTAMEKGRGLEGIANADAFSEALNTYYVRNFNSYKSDGSALTAANYALQTAPKTMSKFFVNPPTIEVDEEAMTAKVTVVRNNIGDKTYKIVFENESGSQTDRYCECVSGTACQRYCQAMGASNARTGNSWYL